MNQKTEEKAKKLVFAKIKKLKAYAIYYHNSKRKINEINIKKINNIENKNKEQSKNNIIEEHNYSKKLLPSLSKNKSVNI